MKKKLLVIDDEVDFGFLMKSFFIPRNIEIYVALTLTDGMKILEEVRPEILFLDNNLPDGMGWDLTDRILSQYPLTQLNLISALSGPKSFPSTVRVLAKPLHLESLQKLYDGDFR